MPDLQVIPYLIGGTNVDRLLQDLASNSRSTASIYGEEPKPYYHTAEWNLWSDEPQNRLTVAVSPSLQLNDQYAVSPMRFNSYATIRVTPHLVTPTVLFAGVSNLQAPSPRLNLRGAYTRVMQMFEEFKMIRKAHLEERGRTISFIDFEE